MSSDAPPPTFTSMLLAGQDDDVEEPKAPINTSCKARLARHHGKSDRPDDEEKPSAPMPAKPDEEKPSAPMPGKRPRGVVTAKKHSPKKSKPSTALVLAAGSSVVAAAAHLAPARVNASTMAYKEEGLMFIGWMTECHGARHDALREARCRMYGLFQVHQAQVDAAEVDIEFKKNALKEAVQQLNLLKTDNKRSKEGLLTACRAAEQQLAGADESRLADLIALAELEARVAKNKAEERAREIAALRPRIIE